LIRSRLFGAALVFTFAALFLAAGASAATVRVAINGSVQVTADPPGGDPSIGISLTGVVGDLTYAGIIRSHRMGRRPSRGQWRRHGYPGRPGTGFVLQGVDVQRL
jgi:hypothetical protein